LSLRILNFFKIPLHLQIGCVQRLRFLFQLTDESAVCQSQSPDAEGTAAQHEQTEGAEEKDFRRKEAEPAIAGHGQNLPDLSGKRKLSAYGVQLKQSLRTGQVLAIQGKDFPEDRELLSQQRILLHQQVKVVLRNEHSESGVFMGQAKCCCEQDCVRSGVRQYGTEDRGDCRSVDAVTSGELVEVQSSPVGKCSGGRPCVFRGKCTNLTIDEYAAGAAGGFLLEEPTQQRSGDAVEQEITGFGLRELFQIFGHLLQQGMRLPEGRADCIGLMPGIDRKCLDKAGLSTQDLQHDHRYPDKQEQHGGDDGVAEGEPARCSVGRVREQIESGEAEQARRESPQGAVASHGDLRRRNRWTQRWCRAACDDRLRRGTACGRLRVRGMRHKCWGR